MTPENIEGRVDFKLKKHKRASVVVRVAAVLGTVAASSALGCREDAMDQEILDALSGVCQGQGVSQAAEYNKDDQEISPVVILNVEGKKHSWTNKVPEEWRPLSVEDTELVACMDKKQQEDMIQDCDYNIGPNVKRYQHFIGIELREAKTGNVIDSDKLEGSTPDRCAEWEEVSKTTIDGSKVSFSKAKEWLEEFVE